MLIYSALLRVSYDANGNILKYLRNGNKTATIVMDSLGYKYYAGTNQLNRVTDNVPAGDYTTPDADIDGQLANNYTYDLIGNLATDNAEKITYIEWNVYGKITIIRYSNTANATIKNIYYFYDAAGNRVGKLAESNTTTTTTSSIYTWYVRDASGNVMATYNSTASGSSYPSILAVSERHLYGSSRLGIFALSKDVKTTPSFTQTTPYKLTFTRGYKYYELTNHLGNVLATISDKKIGVSGNGNTIDYYNADVVSANDYYPGGMDMPGRSYSIVNTNYRYGFNGKEKDKESPVQYDYGFRIYDPRLVRFKSVDPLAKSYPWNSPYSYAEGDVIRAIDLDGLEKVIVNTVSFAPFDYFGADPWGTYVGSGNNRRFGAHISSTVINETTIENYKIRSEAALDLTTMKETSHTAFGSTAHYLAYAPGAFQLPLRSSKTGYATASFKDFYSGEASGYPSTTLGIDYHLIGANAAAPSWAPSANVDVNVKINFWKTDNAKEIGVSGEVKGDRFPSNENYLTDEKNNKLFLGVSGINSENADNAPYTELPGNYKRKMSSFYFTILFNDDNSFKGVRTSNGKEYNLADWTKRFTDLNPKSSKTGTTVSSSTSDKDNFKGVAK